MSRDTNSNWFEDAIRWCRKFVFEDAIRRCRKFVFEDAIRWCRNFVFEDAIWWCRNLVYVAVVVSLLVSAIWFLQAAAKFLDLICLIFVQKMLCPDVDPLPEGCLAQKDAFYEELILSVNVIDAALMAAIFMIIAFGLYELFISEIDTKNADERTVKGKILKIESMDDLKAKLSKVIMLVLTVKVFALALGMDYEGVTTDDLVNLALVIVLIAAAILLSHSSIHIDIKKSDDGRKRLKQPAILIKK